MVREFLRIEAAGGILLATAALCALICANSALGGIYEAFLQTPLSVQIGALTIAKPLILWINDGLTAVSFFLVGLALKREFKTGELSCLSAGRLTGACRLRRHGYPPL
jgi:NhaA family Na+:H+ antiporter